MLRSRATDASDTALARRDPVTLRAVLTRAPSFACLVGALVFFWFSLTPSLLPRWWVMQAVVTGLAAAIGYLIGATVGSLGSAIRPRSGWDVTLTTIKRGTWITFGVLAVLVVGFGLASWPSVADSRLRGA